MGANLALQALFATALALPVLAAQPHWRSPDESFTQRHDERARAFQEAIEQRARERELEQVAQGKGTPVPGETLADPELQKRVLAGLIEVEQLRAPLCTDHTVLRTEAVGRDVDARQVFERWVLDRCGERVAYRLVFSPFFTRGRGLVILDERSSVVFTPEPRD